MTGGPSEHKFIFMTVISSDKPVTIGVQDFDNCTRRKRVIKFVFAVEGKVFCKTIRPCQIWAGLMNT